jgi:hypothetical protein
VLRQQPLPGRRLLPLMKELVLEQSLSSMQTPVT